MYTLLGFAPSIAFYVAMRLVTVVATLGIAAGVALRVAGSNWARSGSPKVLEIGSVVAFAALAAFTAVAHWRSTLPAVGSRSIADYRGLSCSHGRPFVAGTAHRRAAVASGD